MNVMFNPNVAYARKTPFGSGITQIANEFVPILKSVSIDLSNVTKVTRENGSNQVIVKMKDATTQVLYCDDNNIVRDICHLPASR